MRRAIAFPCAGETLAGTLDLAAGTTGLLIVSGGREVRIGAHRGMAALAATVAAAGFPVFRYDRRGIGDSTGEDSGFLGAAADLAAAAAAFRRAMPPLDRLVGYGNCDGASALALFGRAAGLDALVLANPWTIDTPDDLPPAAAIGVRYRQRLADPGAWRRLLSGDVDLRLLGRGLAKLARGWRRPAPLARQVAAAIAQWGDDATVVLARGDATAQAFAAAAPRSAATAHTIETDSHSFARLADQQALRDAVLAALAPR